QSLDLKLRGRVFKVEARSRIVLIVQEPVNGVDVDADVDGVRLEAMGPRRSDQAVPLGSSGTVAKPLPRLAEIPGHGQGVALGKPREGVLRRLRVAIEKRLDEVRNVLGAERSHGDGQVQAVVKMRVASVTNGVEGLPGRIFAVGQP